jgi:hypothetical protein
MNSTRAAKSGAAPELGPFQTKKIPQRPEQRHLGICSLEITFLPIHIELHFRPPSTVNTTRRSLSFWSNRSYIEIGIVRQGYPPQAGVTDDIDSIVGAAL